MDAATGVAADAGLRTRSRLSYLLAILVVTLIVGGVAYYGLNVIRASTFGKERAFRVLGEVAEQFQNLQINLVGVLSNVPERLRRCSGVACDKGRAQFARKLDLKVRLQDVSVRQSAFDALCSVNDRSAAFIAYTNEPNLPFKLFSCAAGTAPLAAASGAGENADPLLRLSYGLTGEVTPMAEDFISQSFFDEVVVALQDGRVVAEVPARERSTPPGSTRLHESKIRSLSVTDATQLLQRAASAARHAAAGEAADKAAGDAMSLHPVLFSDEIAGQKYNVFVIGFRLSYPTVGIRGEEPPANRGIVYLIGLKRVDLRADIVGALGPSGTFVVTVIIAAIFFCFPLLGLRLKSARDPITWPEAASCLMSLVLLSALVAIVVCWLWSQQELLRWADRGARVYAEEIRRRLIDELGNDAVLLGGYRDEMFRDLNREREETDERGCWESFSTQPMPIRALPPVESADDALRTSPYRWPQLQLGRAEMPQASPRRWSADDDSCNTLQLRAPEATDGLKSWSPLRSNFAALADGKMAGPRVTAYAVVPVKRDFEIKDRPYFQMLELDGEWRLPVEDPRNAVHSLQFVAQRLFNRGDGARVLQIAVPRNREDAFDGLVSGDTRAHGLTAAVAPLFLKFAVIDRDGAVLFHSDDSRSLTENFLVEAERNAMLRSAVAREQSGHFDGNYNGIPHRFYYQPLDGVPWGVVAFYPTRSVLELSSQAGVSALVAYGAIVVLAVAIFILVTVIVGRAAMKRFIARFWPRPQSEHDYEMWGVAAALGTIGFMLLFAWPNGAPGRTTAAFVIVFVGVVLLLAARFWKGHAYAMCISTLLIFGAAIPATGLALRYHDAQLEALLRSGLSGALEDIERRHAVIAHDLRRWEPNAAVRQRDLPDAWTLAEHPSAVPVPGYRVQVRPSPDAQSRWAMTAFTVPPWAMPSSTPHLNGWMQYIWRETASTAEQAQRSSLLRDERTIDNWHLVTSDGRDIAVSAGWRSAVIDDSQATSLVWFSDGLAAIAAIAVILLCSSLVSRRLLGAHVAWPAKYSGRDIMPESPATVIYYRGAAAASVEDALQRVDQNINLATDARLLRGQSLQVPAGTLLFTDLDLAVIDPQRRQQVLDLLESLLCRDDVELIITANRSPLRRLHRPGLYPESRAGDEPGYAELIRWDSVMASFQEVLQPAVPASQAERPTAKLADYHRTWKLCTRDERLVLHQLATGKLANPENADVIGVLIRYGLVVVDPLPRIADHGFRHFVSTAETAADIASWQRDASRSAWKTVRAPIIGVLMVLVLILVVWFSWAGGDTFKVFSTVVVGAVALLGNLTNAFNFVRSTSSAAKN